MAHCGQVISGAYTTFKYEPLNYFMPSIRLVRVHPELSRDGLIQCDLRHAMITDSGSKDHDKDEYACVSYVWGSADRGNYILLNGSRFWVRQNLYDFLSVIRTNCVTPKDLLPCQWLWMDALCIDQETTTERNHQVQQMGQIFSNARYVLSWLGLNPAIDRFFVKTSQRKPCLDGFKAFRRAENWRRAWITQEIVLASRVVFMTGEASLDGHAMPFSYESYCKDYGIFSLLDADWRRDLRDGRLIGLFKTFSNKQCVNPRDRIFSLLSICCDSSDIEVDYNLPVQTMALNLLRTDQDRLCFCSCRLLDTEFGLADETFDGGVPRLGWERVTPFAEVTLPISRCYCPSGDCSCRGRITAEQFPDGAVYFELKLENICDVFRGSVLFGIRKNKSIAHLQLERRTRLYRRRGNFHQVQHGWSVQLSGDAVYCTIRMSFDAIANLTRILSPFQACCDTIDPPKKGLKDSYLNLRPETTRMRICHEDEWGDTSHNVGFYAGDLVHPFPLR